MKNTLKNMIFLGGVLFSGLSFGQFKGSQYDVCDVDPRGQRVAFIVAQGPDTEDLTQTVGGLVDEIREKYPLASIQFCPNVTTEGLQSAYDKLRADSQQISKVNLFLVTHGIVNEAGTFCIKTYEGGKSSWTPDSALKKIIQSTPTFLSLFTCHSGAFDLSGYENPVFGGCPAEVESYRCLLYDWVVRFKKIQFLKPENVCRVWNEIVEGENKAMIRKTRVQPGWLAPKGSQGPVIGPRVLGKQALSH